MPFGGYDEFLLSCMLQETAKTVAHLFSIGCYDIMDTTWSN